MKDKARKPTTTPRVPASAPKLNGVVGMRVTRRSQRDQAFIVVLAALSLSSCGPLPKGEHWKGSFIHLDPPQYSFAVPDGWREAKALDFPSLGFNRRMFATLDAASRSALSSARRDRDARSRYGAHFVPGCVDSDWFRAWLGGLVRSEGSLRFGLSEREKDAIWPRCSASRIHLCIGRYSAYTAITTRFRSLTWASPRTEQKASLALRRLPPRYDSTERRLV